MYRLPVLDVLLHAILRSLAQDTGVHDLGVEADRRDIAVDMRAQILRRDFGLVAIEIARERPEARRVLLARAFGGDRALLGPRMNVQRKVLPDQAHAILVGGVDHRLDLAESPRAVGAFEVAELDYRYRRGRGADRRMVVEMQLVDVHLLPRMSAVDHRVMLRD